MKNKVIKAIEIFILFIFSISVSSCSQNSNTDIFKIRLNEVTRSVFYAPQYVALGLNYFKDENLDIELITADGSDKTMTAVLSSQADIGLLGTSSVISVYKQGKKDCPVLFAGITQRDGSFLVGRNSEFTWEDLRGKEIIAGRKGGVPEMVLEYILSGKGFDIRSDLKLLNNIQFNLMSIAFSRGTGDYVALFEPTASTLVKEKHFYILNALGEECEKIAYTGYCCSKSYLESNKNVVKKFVKAIYKAQKWIKSHTAQETAKLIAPYFVDSDEILLTECVGNYLKHDVWCQNPEVSKESFDLMQEIMIKAGELDSKVDFDNIVNTKLCKEIIENEKAI